MTGEGTQTNPYIITTADELYSMGTLGGTDVYFRLEADIDFNGTQYAETFEPIPLYCAELDGNGHTIRNIYCNSDSTVTVFSDMTSNTSAQTAVIKNLVIENTELVGADITFFAKNSGSVKGTIRLEGCCFSIRFTLTAKVTNGSSSQKGLLHDIYRIPDVYMCTMKIEMKLVAGHPLIAKGTVNRSQFDVNVSFVDSRISSQGYTALFSSTDMTDTAVFGRISADNTGTANCYHYADEGNHSNCYQAVEYNNISTLYWNSTIRTPCFYNKDLAECVTEFSNSPSSGVNYSEVLALTTEQCKDAGYLRSAGFICEGAV